MQWTPRSIGHRNHGLELKHTKSRPHGFRCFQIAGEDNKVERYFGADGGICRNHLRPFGRPIAFHLRDGAHAIITDGEHGSNAQQSRQTLRREALRRGLGEADGGHEHPKVGGAQALIMIVAIAPVAAKAI